VKSMPDLTDAPPERSYQSVLSSLRVFAECWVVGKAECHLTILVRASDIPCMLGEPREQMTRND
jgi:hypothetical protein